MGPTILTKARKFGKLSKLCSSKVTKVVRSDFSCAGRFLIGHRAGIVLGTSFIAGLPYTSVVLTTSLNKMNRTQYT
jgi:hypothetical protein